VPLDLEAARGKVTEWLRNVPVQNAIRSQFRRFLRMFKDDAGDRLYARVIENMVLGEWREVAGRRGGGFEGGGGSMTRSRAARTRPRPWPVRHCHVAHPRPPTSGAPTLPGAANKQSLEVDWRHMHQLLGMRPVAAACADAPRDVLALLDVAAGEVVFGAYPEYEQIHRDIHVRITGLPVDDSIRELR
jgi:hypothetical protein